MTIAFDNSYARLPEQFFSHQAPTPVATPSLIRLNKRLARELQLDADWLSSPEGVATLAGNHVPQGACPIAQVYAGHQFGGWVPRLGDGRAILLGEVIDRKGQRRDIQLKGSGRTPYSRRGDGRAWLGPVLREYVVSEAMHALGVPTTRALAAVTTGERVQREKGFPGAIVTRVASSHVRVGTFQYFAARRDTDALKVLTDHVIARHYPNAETALDLLIEVLNAQARLVAQWMGVGFIHGVMNTDNMTISGETIDYGPCAFMDRYNPLQVYSSIDQYGRYAYNQQADIAGWNLAQLASALLPLIDEDEDRAIAKATEAMQLFPPAFRNAWLNVFRTKIGLASYEEEDAELIQDLLNRMATSGADFTNTFRALSDGDARAEFTDPATFDQWEARWKARLSHEATPADARKATMQKANPAIIPRNHQIEKVITAALQEDFAPFHTLTEALQRPFEQRDETTALRQPPLPEEIVHRTFCGT